MSNNSVKCYVPTSKGPIRYQNLRPGSFFTIVAEPSRGIRQSTDTRVYQRAYDGFYSFHTASPTPCVLMPNDLVQPLKLQQM